MTRLLSKTIQASTPLDSIPVKMDLDVIEGEADAG
jgi:hypothetical protein